MAGFLESTMEEAALEWLREVDWTPGHGPEMAPGELYEERAEFGRVVLEQRLRHALARLNPGLPQESLDDAFRKLTRPEGTTLEARNQAVHRMFFDGVTITVGPRGARARVTGCANVENNEWPALREATP